MSLYRDEYGHEKNPSPVSPVMTEIVGGALDAYYTRIRHMEDEIRWLRSSENRLGNQVGSLESKVEEHWASREEQAKRADNAEGKARVLQGQLDAKVTEAAKQEKVIEQYAAWRTAVREALKDLPEDLEWLSRDDDEGGAGTSSARQVIAVLQRIEKLSYPVVGES